MFSKTVYDFPSYKGSGPSFSYKILYLYCGTIILPTTTLPFMSEVLSYPISLQSSEFYGINTKYKFSK